MFKVKAVCCVKSKTFKTLDEQIDILKSKGLIIDDIDLSNFFPDHFVRTFVDQKDDFYFSQSNYFEALKILKIIF